LTPDNHSNNPAKSDTPFMFNQTTAARTKAVAANATAVVRSQVSAKLYLSLMRD
jgi:hypothetical protein